MNREKTFVSDDRWCTFKYPANWSVIRENEAYLFLDENDWKGNFRITAMRISGKDTINLDDHIYKEVQKKKGAKLISLGGSVLCH